MIEENTFVIVSTYLSYIVLSVVLTVWVAQTLHKNGRVFLVEVFGGNESLADSVNHLLVVAKRGAGNRSAFVENRLGFIGFRRDALFQFNNF